MNTWNSSQYLKFATERTQPSIAAITPHYPPQANGKVLLPFRRLFVIAYR